MLKFKIFQLINVAQHGDSRLAMGLSETSVAISVIHPEKRMVDPHVFFLLPREIHHFVTRSQRWNPKIPVKNQADHGWNRNLAMSN